MESNIILIVLLLVAVIGKANSVALGICALLFFKLLNIDKYVFPSLQANGISIGVVILIASILVPIANGTVRFSNIKGVFSSFLGIFALLISLFTTYLSGLGMQYLTIQGHSEVMPALIIGAVIAAAFLGGVPVGPMITSGIIALGLKAFHKIGM
ncbi:DUF441 domain-containing protein [Clostridium fermenticellae]|uniref:UPF0756 membrane protein D4Z93_08365 n=1 Tax=Clostridium fermenticellae TaxID=2068654 RepID=A0A386H4D6_9CLOT|nr:DUF441 domain-containing protein [Clostridium fermenticellae]AYD40540.1 DUF441 domain-containing protein [Clostridium fermenticellae]